MEDLQSSPLSDYSFIGEDLKYFAGLSTLLVATVQEVKDRITQIEFIFCRQLFPSFQSRSKALQKRIAETKKAEEDEWKKKESSLLHQIKELQREKDQALQKEQLVITSLDQERANARTYQKLLSEHENEKKLLLIKLENAEKNDEVVQLQVQLKQKTEEMKKKEDLEEKMMQKINLKEQELLIEQNRCKDAIAQFMKLKKSYKELKSQYEFLLKRSSFTTQNKPYDFRIESSSPGHHQNQQIPLGFKEATFPAPMMNRNENDDRLEENLQDNGGASVIPKSNFHFNSNSTTVSSSSHIRKSPIKPKAEAFTGQKRPVPQWRETHSRQEPGGADPHDDFLDTPMESIKANANKILKEDHDVSDFAPKGMDAGDPNDETQDAVADVKLQEKETSAPLPNIKSFKYVEPVRKKAERESLKGIECRQCKKFYEAVLPDEAKNDDKSNSKIRCEHHDGVSRHRYRYIPPMTPEGFWNIGFDSDL